MTRFDSLCFGLLAGGKSFRMGVDKASLDWRGRPLWQHQLRLAAEIGADEVLISGRLEGPYAGAAGVVADEVADCGPLAGIGVLLSAMKSNWLVAVAVDMPLLDGGTLRELVRAGAGRIGVVPVVNHRAEPLAAVYPRTAIELARDCLNSEDRSLQNFVQRAAAAKLVQLLPWPADRATGFRSANTPTEWAALRAE